MAFRDMLKKKMATVNDRPVELPERTTAGDIMRKVGIDSSRYQLVGANPDGTTSIYPPDATITIREGFRFESQLSSYNG